MTVFDVRAGPQPCDRGCHIGTTPSGATLDLSFEMAEKWPRPGRTSRSQADSADNTMALNWTNLHHPDPTEVPTRLYPPAVGRSNPSAHTWIRAGAPVSCPHLWLGQGRRA
ncbi:hypothetical protein GCM10027089_31750 [Nocardia thraciensis]